MRKKGPIADTLIIKLPLKNMCNAKTTNIFYMIQYGENE